MSPFSYIVINLARQIRPHEITFSGVNSTLPMLACLLAKRAYDFHILRTSTSPAASSRNRGRFRIRAAIRRS